MVFGYRMFRLSCEGFKATCAMISKGTLMGTPNRDPPEYSRNIIEHKDPGRYIPIIFLLNSWGSLFGVPSKVPLIRIFWTPESRIFA